MCVQRKSTICAFLKKKYLLLFLSHQFWYHPTGTQEKSWQSAKIAESRENSMKYFILGKQIGVHVSFGILFISLMLQIHDIIIKDTFHRLEFLVKNELHVGPLAWPVMRKSYQFILRLLRVADVCVFIQYGSSLAHYRPKLHWGCLPNSNLIPTKHTKISRTNFTWPKFLWSVIQL